MTIRLDQFLFMYYIISLKFLVALPSMYIITSWSYTTDHEAKTPPCYLAIHYHSFSQVGGSQLVLCYLAIGVDDLLSQVQLSAWRAVLSLHGLSRIC